MVGNIQVAYKPYVEEQQAIIDYDDYKTSQEL